jgi:DNA-binding NtrC family response regulator
MAPALQAKLLHVLQDAEFTKLGSNKKITINVRVVTATNRDLEEMLVSGQFREDLYYRLKVIEAVVPPLRERRDEIPRLTDFFTAKYSERYNRPVRPLSDEIRRLLLGYGWPGNVRELENMIKRFVILQDEELVKRELRTVRTAPHPAAAVSDTASLPLPQRPPASADEEKEDHRATDGTGTDRPRLADVAREAALKAERTMIADALRRVQWNRRKAAEMLGVSYKTLLNKIKETGLEPR